MLSFLKKFFYDSKTGVTLGDGWFAKWKGRDHFVLERNEYRYGIYVPITARRKLRAVRTLNTKEMPLFWLQPHDNEMLTEDDRKVIISKAVLTIKLCREELDVIKDGC